MGAVIATIVGSNIFTDTVSDRNISQFKCLVIETANTVDATDTFTVDLANYGGTTLLGIDGCKHTTDNSVITTEAPTTTVSSTTVTMTVPSGTNDDKRIAKLYFT